MTKNAEMKALLENAFLAGVRASHPDTFLAIGDLRFAFRDAVARQKGRVIALGAGKASAAMARALEREWALAGGSALEGLVVTREGYEAETNFIEIVTGGHPYPAQASEAIAARMLEMAKTLSADDMLIGLWSGGGSALLACPPEGLAFEKLITLTKVLLSSGADIHEINTVRKHLSRVSGGRLAMAAAPAALLNLIIPDVVGGEDSETLSAVASGPTVPDPTTVADAAHILERFGQAAFVAHLTETPKTWDEIGVETRRTILGDGITAVVAGESALERQGFKLAHKDAAVTGEAREVARAHAALAQKIGARGEKAFIVTGGELTVTSAEGGQGGPNQEYALALAIALEGATGIAALAGDTDGIDGNGAAAGAFVFPDTLARMRAGGVDPRQALESHNSGAAFAAIDDLLISGPTQTNVNDLRLIVING